MAQVERETGQDGFEVRVEWNAKRLVKMVLVPLLVDFLLFWPWHGRIVQSAPSIGVAVLVVQLGIWQSQYRMWRAGRLMRIDTAGVTVRGEPTVAWSDLDRVVVGRDRVVAFHASRPDVELPLGTLGIRSRDPRRLRTRLIQLYGTPLVVRPFVYGLTARDFVNAVRTYSGGLPVFA